MCHDIDGCIRELNSPPSPCDAHNLTGGVSELASAEEQGDKENTQTLLAELREKAPLNPDVISCTVKEKMKNGDASMAYKLAVCGRSLHPRNDELAGLYQKCKKQI